MRLTFCARGAVLYTDAAGRQRVAAADPVGRVSCHPQPPTPKIMKPLNPLHHIALALGSLMTASSALATEGNGLGLSPDGLENFLVGAAPPPGVHLLVYAGSARYDKLLGSTGDHIGAPDFKINVNFVVPRLVWVTNQKFFGGDLIFQALLPLTSVKVKAGGATFKSSGAADAIIGTAVAWHHSPVLHSVVGVDVYLPTGKYSATDPSSLGKNIWGVQPVYAVSYINPTGLNADTKIMYDINGRNDDTRTRSGQALHADFSAGWGLGNGWVVGLGGHFFQQVTSDSGPNAGTGKARAVGLGPSIRYANAKGLLFTAKYQEESGVRNRVQGSQFLLKASVPF
jgi:hypothetical protein